MMLGQLSNQESLRDLIVALEAHHSKCYHLGMGKNVSKSSLTRANQDRAYRIFEEYAFYLVSEIQKNGSNNTSRLKSSGVLLRMPLEYKSMLPFVLTCYYRQEQYETREKHIRSLADFKHFAD